MIMSLVMVISLGSFTTYAHALESNNDYAFLSEKYFFVIETVDSNINVKNGGVLYNSEWSIISLQNITVDIWDEESDIVWVNGNLDSGEQFWFTWNLTESEDISGFWIYDGENLTEHHNYHNHLYKLS